jgi:hypothetical protein
MARPRSVGRAEQGFLPQGDECIEELSEFIWFYLMPAVAWWENSSYNFFPFSFPPPLSSNYLPHQLFSKDLALLTPPEPVLLSHEGLYHHSMQFLQFFQQFPLVLLALLLHKVRQNFLDSKFFCFSSAILLRPPSSGRPAA